MNRLREIKKAVILWITPFLAESDNYKNVYIGADFSDDVKIPAIIVDIEGRKPITDGTNGLCGYDFITEAKTILYVTDYVIAFNCHAVVQEESSDIASYIVRKIREANGLPTSEDVNITRRFDDMALGMPKLADKGASKHWVCPGYMSLRAQEAITTEPGMVYKEEDV